MKRLLYQTLIKNSLEYIDKQLFTRVTLFRIITLTLIIIITSLFYPLFIYLGLSKRTYVIFGLILSGLLIISSTMVKSTVLEWFKWRKFRDRILSLKRDIRIRLFEIPLPSLIPIIYSTGAIPLLIPITFQVLWFNYSLWKASKRLREEMLTTLFFDQRLPMQIELSKEKWAGFNSEKPYMVTKEFTERRGKVIGKIYYKNLTPETIAQLLPEMVSQSYSWNTIAEELEIDARFRDELNLVIAEDILEHMSINGRLRTAWRTQRETMLETEEKRKQYLRIRILRELISVRGLYDRLSDIENLRRALDFTESLAGMDR